SFTTTFLLPQAATVTASLLAADGRVVRTFAPRRLAAGEQLETWTLGEGVNSGAYFLRLAGDDGREASLPLLIH
ncbi:MAG: hypothetical protein AAFZ52_18620, partial [Bacteroidota bacterium]